jgi:hypothetical protein
MQVHIAPRKICGGIVSIFEGIYHKFNDMNFSLQLLVAYVLTIVQITERYGILK